MYQASSGTFAVKPQPTYNAPASTQGWCFHFHTLSTMPEDFAQQSYLDLLHVGSQGQFNISMYGTLPMCTLIGLYNLDVPFQTHTGIFQTSVRQIPTREGLLAIRLTNGFYHSHACPLSEFTQTDAYMAHTRSKDSKRYHVCA